MYYLIEHSPKGLTVVGTFTMEEEAQNGALKLWNKYCDYVVTKVV